MNERGNYVKKKDKKVIEWVRYELGGKIIKVSKYQFFLTKEMYIKLKLTNYNVMIKFGKQDLIDINDIKKIQD